MTAKAVGIFTLAVVAIYFAVGWFGYDWASQYLAASVSQPIVVGSVNEAFMIRLMATLSVTLTGLCVGVGAWLGARSSKPHFMRIALILVLISIAAAVGWFLYLLQRLSALVDQTGQAVGTTDVALSLSVLNLYEIGLFASVCVVVAAVVLALVYRPAGGT